MKKIQFMSVLAISIAFMVGFSNASILGQDILVSWFQDSDYKTSNKIIQGKFDSSGRYHICAGDRSSCSSTYDIFQISYESSSKVSRICAGNRSSCSSTYDIFQIKDGYICPGNVSSCSKSKSLNGVYFLFPIESLIAIMEGNNVSYSCFTDDDRCYKNNSYIQTSKTSDVYYICDGGDDSKCSKSNSVYQIKKNNETYYICAGYETSCSSYNDIYQIKVVSDKYYICDGDEYNCSSYNDMLWIKKDSDKYYICDGDEYNCSNYNDMLRIKKNSNIYYSCAGKEYTCTRQNSYIETMTKDNGGTNSSSSSNISSNTQNDAFNLWLDAMLNCMFEYGENVTANDNLQCICLDGYVRNSDHSACVISIPNNQTNNQTNNQNTNKSNNGGYYSNGFSQEYKDAYQFAFSNKITTMPTIEQANMHGEIIRAEIAKMLANWVKSLGYTPDTSKSCKFNDISSVKGDLYTAIIESCQLGIMGQGISDFRPYDKITRGEVSTAISRILRGSQFEGGSPYYASHMNALKTAGILDNISSPGINELRGNVMVMLMRASDSDELVNCDDPVTILACEVEPSQCPKTCLKEAEEIDVDALVEAVLSEQEEESVKDKSGDLIITISKNTNGKIVSEGESKLDKIKFKADDEDIKLVSLVFEYYGYVSPNELHFIWLEDKNGNKISDMGTVENNGQVKLRLEKDYVDIKKGKTLEATLVVSGKFKSGETLGLKLVDLLASAQNIDLNGEPSIYKR